MQQGLEDVLMIDSVAAGGNARSWASLDQINGTQELLKRKMSDLLSIQDC